MATKRLLVVLLSVLAVLCAAPVAECTEEPIAISDACKFVRESEVQQEDIPRLRASWFADARYNPAISIDKEFGFAVAAMDRTLAVGDYATASEMCEQHYSQYCMVWLWNARCRRAYEGLEKLDEAEPFRRLAAGIGHYLFASGDGKTAETAYVVIDLLEQNLVLEILKLERTGQSYFSRSGHNYDLILTRHLETGEEGSIIFDVSAMFSAYERRVGGNEEGN